MIVLIRLDGGQQYIIRSLPRMNDLRYGLRVPLELGLKRFERSETEKIESTHFV